MNIYLFDNEDRLANCAAEFAVKKLQVSIKKKSMACFVVATGRSQVKLLKSLTEYSGLDWNKTVMFHLDEFVGISQNHPASFQKYIHERFTDIVHPAKAHFIHGDSKDLETECERLNSLISQYIVDLVFVGIGMNGHLAFNDPPADFKAETPYRIVQLDQRNRQQQREYFTSIEQVPKLAISMSIRQIMKAEAIICLATGKSKAEIVQKSLHGEITPECPASILQRHPNVSIFLDEKAASLLPKVFIRKYSASR
jgi:glucosamine-6-phosphate deaminase